VGLLHEFVQALNSGGLWYSAAEAANAGVMGAVPATAVSDPLTTLVDLAQPLGIFSPVAALTGRSLFVNGAAGAPGTAAHPDGGNGGAGGAAGLQGAGGDGGAGGNGGGC
jgi:hypothetical protein